MIGLKRRSYLGQGEKILFSEGLIGGITSHLETNTADQLHCHETLHPILVLNGGNLEKRTRYDIERLPGVIILYDAGEPHNSTKTIPFSRHVNLEIE